MRSGGWWTGGREELGLEFEHEALELFIMLAGEQTKQIANELEKLDLYLGKERRMVTEDDVRLLVPLSRAAVIFETGQAIQRGNVARAIQLVDEQLAAEESAIGIMRASIINVVRNLYMAKLILEKFKAPSGNYSGFAGSAQQAAAGRARLAAAEKGRLGSECLSDFPSGRKRAELRSRRTPSRDGGDAEGGPATGDNRAGP